MHAAWTVRNEALLVQEIDSESYWKISVSDLGDRKKIETFGRN